jgi:hypothetical protein
MPAPQATRIPDANVSAKMTTTAQYSAKAASMGHPSLNLSLPFMGITLSFMSSPVPAVKTRRENKSRSRRAAGPKGTSSVSLHAVPPHRCVATSMADGPAGSAAPA